MKHFPLMAAVFEGCLTPAAIGLGWLLGTPTLATLFHFDGRDALLGVAAALPPLGIFWFCLVCPWRPFAEIAKITVETIVPLFRGCGLTQLAIISALAGLGEETLFRGVVQAAAAQAIGGAYGVWLGLLAAAILFGLLHLITPTYGVLAGLIGLYLGGLWLATHNLLTPIVAHGTYDFLALLYLVRIRGERRGERGEG
jgi:membrane protease YdiL (CAAX protease family)